MGLHMAIWAPIYGGPEEKYRMECSVKKMEEMIKRINKENK